MGRLIDYNDVYNAIQITTDNFGVAKKVVEDNMLTMLSKIETVDAIPKDKYKARLKADLEAILVELQLEIEEKATEICDDGWWLTYNWLIQQKINALKEKGNKLDESKLDES